MADLNALIPPGSGFANLEAAIGINDAGQIAGYGTFTNGVYHGFLVTPGTAMAPITISNPTFSGGSFSFSFATQSGHSYAAQFTTPFSDTNTRVTFTNLVGNGTTVRLTDSTATDSERYYRVIAPYGGHFRKS
jgi:probable HAF family extracellular repeat protein